MRLYIKIVLIIKFLIIFYPVFSQQLRLPDEFIVGQMTDKPDSLNLKTDLKGFNKFNKIDYLIYKPYLFQSSFTEIPAQKDNFGYLFLKAGTQPNAEVRTMFVNPQQPEVNAFVQYYRKKYKNDYESMFFNFLWQPQKYYSNFMFSPFVEINISDFSAGDVINNNFPLHQPVLQTKTSNFKAGFQSKPDEVLLFDNFDMSFSFTSSEQTTDKDYKKNYLDLDTYITSPYLKIADKTETSLYLRNKKVHLDNNLYWHNVPLFNSASDIFAFNFSYSKYLMPSILFEKSFYLTNDLQFIINNKPFINPSSTYERYQFFPFAENDLIKYVEQTPVNFSAYFNFLNPLNLRTGFKAEFIKNFYYINYHNNRYFANNGDLQRLGIFLCSEIQWQNFSISTENYLNDSSLKHQSTDIKKSKQLWEPHFININTVEYKINNFKTGLRAGTYINRYALDDEKLKNVFLLDSTNKLMINKNLSINLNVRNILNTGNFNNGYINGRDTDIPNGKYLPGNLPEEKINAELLIMLYF